MVAKASYGDDRCVYKARKHNFIVLYIKQLWTNMITKIILKNFMSHAHTVLELGPGLNVVIGPNNCGKSAIVAALQAVVSGSKGDFMVRHGQTRASVTVHTSEGHVIKWRRRRSVSYVINGREIHRVGLSTPDDLHDFLRLPLVTLDDRAGRALDIHIADQKNPIFLLNGSPADAAAFFASSTDGAYVMEMQRLHRLHTQERRRECELLSTQQATLDLQLEALSPLDDLSLRADALQHEEDALNLLSTQILNLQDQTASLKALQTDTEHHTTSAATLALLQSPPDLPDWEPLDQILQNLQQQTHTTQTQRDTATALNPLQSPPDLPALADLERHLHDLTTQLPTAHRHKNTAAALSLLQSPPDLPDPTPLQTLLADLTHQRPLTYVAAQRASTLSVLQAFLDLPDPDSLISHLHDHTAAHHATTRPRLHHQILSQLQSPPDLPDPDALQSLLQHLTTATRQNPPTHIPSPAPPPDLPDPEPLNNLSNDLQRANNTALPLRQTHKTLSLLKSPPDLPDPSPLSALIDALTSANIPHTHTLTLQSPPELPDPSPLIALIDALTSANIPHTPPIHLSNPPDLHDPHTIDTLQTLIDTLDHAQTEATRASTTHVDTERAWLLISAQLEAIAPGHRCPTCGNPLSES